MKLLRTAEYQQRLILQSWYKRISLVTSLSLNAVSAATFIIHSHPHRLHHHAH